MEGTVVEFLALVGADTVAVAAGTVVVVAITTVVGYEEATVQTAEEESGSS